MLSNAGRLLAFLSLLAIFGCATLRPIETDQPVELRDNQGILLIDVASNVPIDRLYLNTMAFLKDFPAGRTLRLFVAPAGSYSWSQLIFDTGISYRMFRHDYWKFRVEPGRVSYPGMLLVHGSRVAFPTDSFSVQTLNRSALSYKMLDEAFPGIAERYPVVYTGRARDEFLIRFQELKRALRTTGEAGGSADAEADRATAPAVEPAVEHEP